MAKIAVVVYSTYGHILGLAKAEVEGLKAAGATVDLLQFPSGEDKDASAAANLPVATPDVLEKYDGFLFGIPSRFGMVPYAFKAFFDGTGKQWASGSYAGKYAGFFVATGTPGGGQETVARNTISVLVHHGIIFVPLGYASAFQDVSNLEEVHGGSPWGAGTFAAGDGSRQPSKLELKIAETQGKTFAATVDKSLGKKSSASAGKSAPAATASSAPKSSAPPKQTTQTTQTTKAAPAKAEQSVRAQAPKESSSKCCGMCTVM